MEIIKFSELKEMIAEYVSPSTKYLAQNADICTERTYFNGVYKVSNYTYGSSDPYRYINLFEKAINFRKSAVIDMDYYRKLKRKSKIEEKKIKEICDAYKPYINTTEEEDYNLTLALFIFIFYDYNTCRKVDFTAPGTVNALSIPYFAEMTLSDNNNFSNFMNVFFDRLRFIDTNDNSRFFLNDLLYNLLATLRICKNELTIPITKPSGSIATDISCLLKKTDINDRKDPVFYSLRDYILMNYNRYYKDDVFKNYIIGINENFLSTIAMNEGANRFITNIRELLLSIYTYKFITNMEGHFDEIINLFLTNNKKLILNQVNFFYERIKPKRYRQYRLYLRHYFMFQVPIIIKLFNNYELAFMIIDREKTEKVKKELYDLLEQSKEFYLKNKKDLYEIVNEFISYQTKQFYWKNSSIYGYDSMYTYRFNRYIYYTILAYIKREVLKAINEGKDVFEELGINSSSQAAFIVNI